MLLKKNLELKTKNTELKKIRDKLKKHVKGFGIATGILAGTTATTFIAGAVNKNKKNIAENKLDALKTKKRTTKEILDEFMNDSANDELITILKIKCKKDNHNLLAGYPLRNKRVTTIQAKGIIAYIEKNCSDLDKLDLSYNLIQEINVSALKKLVLFNIVENQLTSITLTTLFDLKKLHIFKNQLISLDLTGLSALSDLNLDSSDLNLDSINSLKIVKYDGSNADVKSHLKSKGFTQNGNTWTR